MRFPAPSLSTGAVEAGVVTDMTDTHENASLESGAVAQDAWSDRRDELPPVEPPSAGFIIQLFVVPGLIVLAVVGAWALFGKLTSSQEDWRKLVVELRSGNEHRRWRAAMGLATMLEADQRRGSGVESLAQNPQIARELSDMLQTELGRGATTDEDLKHQSFLTRTLGTLDVPETVLPVLCDAMQPGQDSEIRRDAVVASAVIVHRYRDRGQTLQTGDLTESVIGVSGETDPLLRQVAAYALGIIPEKPAHDRLSRMLDDRDSYARLNAAIGLARHGSLEGFDVFQQTLEDYSKLENVESESRSANEEQRRAMGDHAAEQVIAIDNTLRALQEVRSELTSEQATVLRPLLDPLAEQNRFARIRLEARNLLNELP